MRLLTHNTLRCPAKDVNGDKCLKLEIIEMEVKESECNFAFIKNMLPSLYWEGVLEAASAIGMTGLPETFDVLLLNDNEFIKAMHNLLLDVHINKGYLICQESSRRFPIDNGIPNMKLPESEV